MSGIEIFGLSHRLFLRNRNVLRVPVPTLALLVLLIPDQHGISAHDSVACSAHSACRCFLARDRQSPYRRLLRHSLSSVGRPTLGNLSNSRTARIPNRSLCIGSPSSIKTTFASALHAVQMTGCSAIVTSNCPIDASRHHRGYDSAAGSCRRGCLDMSPGCSLPNRARRGGTSSESRRSWNRSSRPACVPQRGGWDRSLRRRS